MNENQLFILLQVNDALFPIGGYSHSYGLETYIQKGIVNSGETALAFIKSSIKNSFLYSELLPARLAYEYTQTNKLDKIVELEEVVEASKSPIEIRAAAQKLGSRFVKTVISMNVDYISDVFARYVEKVKQFAKEENSEFMEICAKVEEEIAQLDKSERAVFLEEMGLKESGLSRIIKKGYELLGLISYLTAGEKEVRAWTIEKGTKAPQAAGKIHSDFEKGFIRAEIVTYDDLVECGGFNQAKEKGKVRSEGKDYVFKDGDVALFRFNV